jgi:hypothetical protein
MLKEYNEKVKCLSDEAKRALRKEWEEKLVAILDDETVAISAAACLKKAQKYMLKAVRALLLAHPPSN